MSRAQPSPLETDNALSQERNRELGGALLAFASAFVSTTGQSLLKEFRELGQSMKEAWDEEAPSVPVSKPMKAMEQRTLSFQLHDVVAEYVAADLHLPLVRKTMDALSEQLANAGFKSASVEAHPGFVVNGSDDYLLWVTRAWLLPDCNVPFNVVLTVNVRTAAPRCGDMFFELKMADEDAVGVLSGRTFRRQGILAMSGTITSVDSWKSWVANGFERLTPDTLSKVFDTAVEHLERVTTP